MAGKKGSKRIKGLIFAFGGPPPTSKRGTGKTSKYAEWIRDFAAQTSEDAWYAGVTPDGETTVASMTVSLRQQVKKLHDSGELLNIEVRTSEDQVWLVDTNFIPEEEGESQEAEA